MVNHFPNCQLLTNKMGLLDTLQSFDQVSTDRKAKPQKLKLNDFFPETYRLDDLKDRELFFRSFKGRVDEHAYSENLHTLWISWTGTTHDSWSHVSEGDIWICKPTGRNQGKGIYLVRDKKEIKKLCMDHDNNQKPGKALKPMNRIIQK